MVHVYLQEITDLYIYEHNGMIIRGFEPLKGYTINSRWTYSNGDTKRNKRNQ